MRLGGRKDALGNTSAWGEKQILGGILFPWRKETFCTLLCLVAIQVEYGCSTREVTLLKYYRRRRSRCSFTTLSSVLVPHHTWVITFKRDAESYLPFSKYSLTRRANAQVLPFETRELSRETPATTVKLQLNYAGFSKETFPHDSATNLFKIVRNHVP